MHVSEKLANLRRHRITIIKSWLSGVKKAKREIDKKKLVVQVMSKFNTTDRTAKELIKVALYELNEILPNKSH